MSEVKAEQEYRVEDEYERWGRVRILTVERVLRTRRAEDSKPNLYAVCVSRIDHDIQNPGTIGKKRRTFVRAESLLTSRYSRVEAECARISGPC